LWRFCGFSVGANNRQHFSRQIKKDTSAGCVLLFFGVSGEAGELKAILLPHYLVMTLLTYFRQGQRSGFFLLTPFLNSKHYHYIKQN
jgi:hypothetical protein